MSNPSSRRRFLISAGAATTIPILPLAAQTPQPATNAPPVQSAGPSSPALPSGYESLGASEAALIEAMVNVMCPADALTPNGVDCGLAIFIDRQLAGGFGKGERYFMQSPWHAGTPELGIQVSLTPEQHFKAGLRAANDQCTKQFGKSFDQLPLADANAFLQKVASGGVTDARVPLAQWFNDLFYPLFTQGCFADPMYGGNKGKVFWKMVGYPGLPAFHTLDMTAYRGKPFPAAKNPQSIQEFS